MPDIIDLEMTDEEYLQLVAEGRDPVLEKLYERQLERLGVSTQTNYYATPSEDMLKKPAGAIVVRASVGLIGLLACLLIGGGVLQAIRGAQSEAPPLNPAQPQSQVLCQQSFAGDCIHLQAGISPLQ